VHLPNKHPQPILFGFAEHVQCEDYPNIIPPNVVGGGTSFITMSDGITECVPRFLVLSDERLNHLELLLLSLTPIIMMML
jgi:hypothetical protein